jgi:hypothetical protein
LSSLFLVSKSDDANNRSLFVVSLTSLCVFPGRHFPVSLTLSLFL